MYIDDQTPSNQNVPMPSQVAGTITFHKHEGVVELSGVSTGDRFSEGYFVDKMLENRKRTLEASTDTGKVTLYECRSKTASFSNNCARVTISFSVALLTQLDDGHAEEGCELEVSFGLDTSTFKGSRGGQIDAKWNDDSSALQISAEHKKSLGSTRRNEEEYHLEGESEGTFDSGHVYIRSNLSVRRTWKWGGDVPIWKDVCDRIAAIRSALAVLLGHVPDHRPLTIQAKVDERAVNVGTMLICTGYKDAKEAPDDANFLVDPNADGGHFINVAANWSQRYMNDAREFRAAVHWAEWSMIFRPTTEHALVNTWMACSKLGLDVEGWTNGHIQRPLDVELDGFDNVLRQAKMCRNYIEHANPKAGSWNYDDPRILCFMRDTVDFYFRASVLCLCEWDVKKWPSRAPYHPMGKYVLDYERNREYAQQTTLKPPVA